MIRLRAENSQKWHDVTAAALDYQITGGALHLVLSAPTLSDSDHDFINSTTPRTWEVKGELYQQLTVSNMPGLGQIRVSAWLDVRGNQERALDAVAQVARRYEA